LLSLGPFELIDNTADEHRLSFPWVTSDPERLAAGSLAPALELWIVEDPVAHSREQATLVLLDADFIVLWMCDPQVSHNTVLDFDGLF
jgi:hypothetical protein